MRSGRWGGSAGGGAEASGRWARGCTSGPPSGTADISFYCDDIEAAVRDLKARGVEFTQDVEDHGYGLVTFFQAPGDFTIQLYQPRYMK